MSLQQAKDRIRGQILDGSITQGKILLNNLYPQEFEYYMMAFEIEGENGIEDRFIFPVMPSSISIKDTKTTNIRRTNAGTTILSDNSFTHKMISISGSFGRKMRLMFGSFEDTGSKVSSRNSKLQFDPNVKTGYGLVKRLERIYHKSTELGGQIGKNDNKPYRVYFYNLSYDQRFLVEILEWNANQTQESNMIWNYSMTMRAVSPLDGLFEQNRVTDFTTISAIGDNVAGLVEGLDNVISFNRVLSLVGDVV